MIHVKKERPARRMMKSSERDDFGSIAQA